MLSKEQAFALCESRTRAIGDLLGLPSTVVSRMEDVPVVPGVTLVGDAGSEVDFLSCGYLPRISGKPKAVAPLLRAFLDGMAAYQTANLDRLTSRKVVA